MKTVDLNEVTGVVEAPAGCGKTHSIVAGLEAAEPNDRPWLVLTHTNAGVSALRQRLLRKRVDPERWVVSTIDAWAIRLLNTFPVRGNLPRGLMDPARLIGTQYNELRGRARDLLRGGHLDELVEASYSRLIVDEYQDCSPVAHETVQHLSTLLPTVALGDPLQAVFNFPGQPVVDWNLAKKDLGFTGELDYPYRWINAGSKPLGDWLLSIRDDLKNNRPVDLTAAPQGHIRFVRDTGEGTTWEHAANAKLASGATSLVMLYSGDKTQQHQVARQLPGAELVEAVGLEDVVTCFSRWNPRFACSKIAGLAYLLGGPLTWPQANEFLNLPPGHPDVRSRGSPGFAFRALGRSFSWSKAREAFEALLTMPGGRIYRPAAADAARRILATATEDPTNVDAITQLVRWEFSFKPRTLQRRAVGSTLLLKGLEAEQAVLLHDSRFDAKHLYVALTRGSKEVIVHAAEPVLQPKQERATD